MMNSTRIKKLASVIIMLLTGLSIITPVAQAKNPTATRYRVPARDTHKFTRYLNCGDRLCIEVTGDTDLDFHVRAPNNRLVTSDKDGTDVYHLHITAPRDGTYTIEVINQGTVYSEYAISCGTF